MISELLHDPAASQKLVVKLTGTVCNIDCTYCFEKAKQIDFDRYMQAEVLEESLARIDKPIELLFHGGEPLLLGRERFAAMLGVVRRNRERVKSVAVQTNGTLLDGQWVDLLFREYADLGIEISISLDGTSAMNRLRVTYGGHPTYDMVRGAFDLLHSGGQSAGLLSVIGRHALTHSDSYVEMLSKIPNLRFVKINPLYDSDPGTLRPDSITPSEFTSFLMQVAAAWIKVRGYERYPVEPLLSFIQQVLGTGSKFCHFNQRKCLNFATLYPDGGMGICDNFSRQEFPIMVDDTRGFRQSLNVLSSSPAMQPFADMMERCSVCEIRELCQGGCLSQRLYFHRNVPSLYEDYCRHRKEMFAFVKGLLGGGEMNA